MDKEIRYYYDYIVDTNLRTGAVSVGRFEFHNITIYALENIVGSAGVPVYYRISKEEHDNPELLKSRSKNHMALCGCVVGMESFSVSDLKEDI